MTVRGRARARVRVRARARVRGARAVPAMVRGVLVVPCAMGPAIGLLVSV